ncbi:MAG TPA: TetR/AcrR family transcriptional regulator [Baekduia sp.]|nr:TetR/AcrR family transcriptional regulator [Baekduia sp.]
MADTSPAPSRREQRRVRTRRALLDAAERLFARDGFHVTTVEDLAAAADVSVSSLYNYFPGGKHELFLAVVEQAVEANRRYMDQAYRPELGALEQVLAAADAYLLFHEDHPGLFDLVAHPRAGLAREAGTPEVEERIAAVVEGEVGRLQEAIARGVAEGELLPVDPRRTATFLWGAWNGVVALRSRADRLRLGDAELRAVLEDGRRLVLEGLAPAGARGPGAALAPEVRFPRAEAPADTNLE